MMGFEVVVKGEMVGLDIMGRVMENKEMSQHILYPEIDEQAINRIVQFASGERGQEYIDAAPYSGPMKTLLMKFVGKSRTPSNVIDRGGDVEVDVDSLLQDIVSLKSDLENYGLDKKGMTGTDANTYFRLMTTLLDKLISYKERALNLKSMQEFTDRVLLVMEQKLPVDTRNEVMDSLREVVSDKK